MKKKYCLISILALLSFSTSALPAQEVELTITGLRNTTGQIVIGLFKDKASYKTEEAYLSRRFQKKDIIDGKMKVSFSLEEGVWGLCLLDDENMSGLMEYNFVGIPREGFGFSDYYHSGFTKPKFESFVFTIEKGQKKIISVKVRYI
jgi:uncharacterized protein (DUF2141 family)